MPTQKELMNQATEQYGVGGGGDFFRFEESGTYKLRILTACYPLATHFFGKGSKPKVCYGAEKGCPYHGEKAPRDDKGEEKKPSVKFVGYVIDRKDGKIKLAELPYSVTSVITDLQEDEDYAFEEFPMPYDVKVTYTKSEAPANMYKTIAVPAREPITEEEAAELDSLLKKRRPEDYVESRKKKQHESDAADKHFDETAMGYDYPEDELGEPVL